MMKKKKEFEITNKEKKKEFKIINEEKKKTVNTKI